jgi:magnesium-transporting ATPase (P-type)
MDAHVDEIGTGPAGLSESEAAARLGRAGPNALPPPAKRSVWLELVAQFTHFFAAMLWVAGVLAIVADLVPLGLAIFVVILFNGLFAFAQEYRAERAADRLRDLLPRRVTVIRDGAHRDLDATELVVGDLVILAPGDRVSADLRLVHAHGVLVDTSTLTGESVPLSSERGDDLFAGSFLVEGEGLALVVATGIDTRLAGIAALTRAGRRPPSPLAVELRRVVRTISTVAVGVGLAFFLVSWALGRPVEDGAIFAIGVTVALVPEGLLPTVTLSLAVGAQRMARQHALIRRLEAVETLGSTTFICSDKTGTLTMNQMAVVEAWTPSGSVRVDGRGYEPTASLDADDDQSMAVARDLALVGVRCSTGHAVYREGEWQAQGDPMEAAIDAFARRLGVDSDADRLTALEGRRFPFDPRRRRMSVVAGEWLLVKGAPDAVLARCDPAPGADEALHAFAARGLRVLAMARRRLDGDLPEDADAAEQGLSLLGLVGIEDPPRAAARDALTACRRAGIRVAMVTGDHPATAAAVAREVGLIGAEERVLVGADLPADEEELGALIDHDGIVLARVAPEDKLRIARALRRQGHVVAMTGDGVNDGPALQEADIGIAMGRSGTDVAREAADLVLLDDDFATIVRAIEQGKSTFANIRRFLTYHLTDNVAELAPFVVWALSGGRFPLALGVLQILALDIGTDTLPAVALGAEPPDRDALRTPPDRGRLLDRTVAVRAFGVLGPTEAFVELLAFVTVFWASGWRPGDSFPEGDVLLAASGAAFAAVVFGQMANAFACRSPWVWPGRLGWFTNRMLVVAVAIELVIVAGFYLIPPVADQLGQSVPPLSGWVVAASAAPAVLAMDALFKAIRRSRALRHRRSVDPVSDDRVG